MPEIDFDVERPIARGKTKAIYGTAAGGADTNAVLIRSLDSITAFNAKRSNELAGKAEIATRTTCNVFEYLNRVGCRTHFLRRGANDSEFVAKRCEMIPIEWVARRVATGSFLKRHPGVPEGFVFSTPKIETFYKDDANDDPQWSDEQILSAAFTYADGQRRVSVNEVALMRRWTGAIFRILERAWRAESCVLVDLKIEFGVDNSGEILLADVIDNDSWRVWPGGDRRLQLDKQFYRDLREVTDESLAELKRNYAKVEEITRRFVTAAAHLSRLVVIMGSPADAAHVDQIEASACRLGVAAVERRVFSAHKSTAELVEMLGGYEADGSGADTVIIAVAGRSNGLGPVIAANCTLPVINAPPPQAEWTDKDAWSSLRMPSGIGCTTVLSATEAALAAAKILATHNTSIFGHVLALQTVNCAQILEADAAAQRLSSTFAKQQKSP